MLHTVCEFRIAVGGEGWVADMTVIYTGAAYEVNLLERTLCDRGSSESISVKLLERTLCDGGSSESISVKLLERTLCAGGARSTPHQCPPPTHTRSRLSAVSYLHNADNPWARIC